MKKSIWCLLCFVVIPLIWIQTAQAISINEQVQIGYYEQDNIQRNGRDPIWWDVLDVRGDYALLISNQALDCIQYNYTNGRILWEDSGIRNWLIGSFYNTAFDYNDRECIVSSLFTENGDPVFMLDEAQILYYDLAYGCEVSEFAKARGVQTGEDNGKGCWWVRMHSTRSNGKTQFVGIHGKIYDSNQATTNNNGVRPAIWVSINEISRYSYPIRTNGVSGRFCLGYTNQKLATRGGPSTTYDDTHTFPLPVGTEVKIYRYQVTNGTPWVEIEFEYGGELVRAWTGKKRVDSDDAINLPGDYTFIDNGILNRDTPGWYGPGTNYRILYDNVSRGTYVDILFSQGDWLLVEFYEPYSSHTYRSWIPSSRIE